MKLFLPPTSDEWLFIGIILFLVIMMITVAEMVRRLLNGSSEITRKFVHVMVGILMAFAPYVFVSAIPAIVISLIAIMGTSFSIRFDFLKSLHDTKRRSYGTVFHPLAFLLLVILFWDVAPYILSISILILAIPDALAAIVGQNLRSPHYFTFSTDKKTYEGSAVMFVSTALLIFLCLWYFNIESRQSWLMIALITALFVTVWELLCTKGWDNLTIPLSTAFMLHYFFFLSPQYRPEHMSTAVLLAMSISLISYIFKFLSDSGSIAVFLLATIIYGLGGWVWTVPILVFFIISSLLSKYGKSKKILLKDIFDKTDKRDAGQVAANGGIAGLIIILWHVYPEWSELYLIFIASVAAVTADTWGTEIGTLARGVPRSMRTFKKVAVGTSGGVSIEGLIGGTIGALIVIYSASVLSDQYFTVLVFIKLAASGLIGSLIDSLLGSSIQAQYQSGEGKLTEKTNIDGVPTQLIRGISWVDNDFVNWICALSGAVTMYFLL